MGLRWEPLEAGDLDRVDAIQHLVHAELPEPRALLAEKRNLFPAGCRRLVGSARMVGYALAHSWTLGRVPVLGAPLGSLPARPDCLHMHDVAILPEGRGRGAAGLYTAYLRDLARAHGLEALACVSVYGTAPFWAGHGFAAASPQPAPGALCSYGAGAVYMTARLTASG